jgi:hypothetical protein
MIIAAVAYIVISVLLIAAAMLLFIKALQMFGLSTSLSKRSLRSIRSIRLTKSNAGYPITQVNIASNRAEIVEMLERQFHSSPSTDL